MTAKLIIMVCVSSLVGTVVGNAIAQPKEVSTIYREPCNFEKADEMYEYAAVVTNVVDGDTIDVVVDLGFKVTTAQRLRLARVDTPERKQENFSEAKSFTQNMIGGKSVLIKTHKISKYGYYLAEITINGENVSDALIAAGLARPYDGGAK